MTDPRPPIQQCANCCHYKLKMMGDGGTEGKCFRYPPTVAVVDLRGVTVTFWPGPKPNEQCGEWKPRLRIADVNNN